MRKESTLNQELVNSPIDKKVLDDLLKAGVLTKEQYDYNLSLLKQ